MNANFKYMDNNIEHNQKSSTSTKILKSPITDDIKKMRDKLVNLSPNEIIDDILKSHRNSLINEKQNLIEFNQNFLENLKQNEITNYVRTMKDRSVKEIKSDFETRIENYNSKTVLYCLEKEKENKEFQSQMNVYKTKNTELEAKIYETERENKALAQKVKESEATIHDLQTKFKIFERIKPTLDEFFKEYPYSSPSEIILDIKEKRDASVKILEDLNSMRARVFKAEKEKRETNDVSKKTIAELLVRIGEVESKHKEEADKQMDEIRHLNFELNSFKICKDENIKLHNMLYSLYNKLITRLSIEKNIKIEEKFIVEEKDFQPRLFDNEEIAQYITLMLNNSDEKKSSQMFRETAAYANMMLRITGKDVKSRFDPVNTFKEIKKELENATDEKNKYKHNLNLLEIKITRYEADIRKLQNELKYKNLQYESLEEKFNKKFQDRLERKKELKNTEIRTRRENRVVSANNFKNVINIKDKEDEKLESNTYNKGNMSQSFKMSNAMDRINNCNQIFLTSDNIFKTEKETMITKKDLNLKKNKEKVSRDIKSASTRPETARMIYLRPKTSSNLFKYSTHFQSQNFNLDNIQAEANGDSSMFLENQNLLEKELVNDKSNNEFKLKKLKLSKNNDKLIKADPNENVNQGALKTLIDHTNKLFLYRTRMKKVVNNSNDNENIFTKFKSKIDNNLKKLKKINKHKEKKKNGLSDRIIDNIDGLIKSLEK